MELNLDWQQRTSALWPEVGYQIRPLKVWAFQELLACWEAQGPPAEEGGKKFPASQGLGLMAAAKPIFAEHVRNLTGVTLLREGQTVAATPAALCEETPLMPLAGEIISRLVEISEVPPVAEKN